MPRTPLALLAAAVLFELAILPAPARGEGSIDLSATVSGLPSSSGAYGPVAEQRLVMRLPPKGDVGIELANRNTKDTFNPAHAQYAAADGRLNWSRYFSTALLVSTASGPPYPARSIALQADAVVHRGLVLSAGGNLNSTFGLGLIRSIKVGATYYHGDGYGSLTYTSSWSGLLGHMEGYLASLAFGHPGKTTETFYAGTGSETDANLQNPANPSLVGERETAASVMIKHWLTARTGFRAGLSFGTLRRADGTAIYARREATIGYFMGLGR